MRRSRMAGLAVLALLPACSGTSWPQEPTPPTRRVLFIGNSLTYVNDLPGMVTAAAAAAGSPIETGMAAGPNLALIDHINGATDALARIRDGHWDYVVLQQGPTTIAICRDSLVLWTRDLVDRIRAAGAEPALLMVWPTAAEPERFDAVRVSFQTAASAVDGLFLPAGEGWRLALAATPPAPVYGGDGFHPSPTGTYLAALVIVERLTGRDPRTLPTQGSNAGIPAGLMPEMVKALQEWAHTANLRWPSRTPTATIPGLDTGSHSPPAGGTC